MMIMKIINNYINDNYNTNGNDDKFNNNTIMIKIITQKHNSNNINTKQLI